MAGIRINWLLKIITEIMRIVKCNWLYCINTGETKFLSSRPGLVESGNSKQVVSSVLVVLVWSYYGAIWTNWFCVTVTFHATNLGGNPSGIIMLLFSIKLHFHKGPWHLNCWS